jgi:hypothetical protein
LNNGGRDFRMPAAYQDGIPTRFYSFATLPDKENHGRREGRPLVSPPSLNRRLAFTLL